MHQIETAEGAMLYLFIARDFFLANLGFAPQWCL